MPEAAVIETPPAVEVPPNEGAAAPPEPEFVWDENPRLQPKTPASDVPPGEAPTPTPAAAAPEGEGEKSKPAEAAKAEVPADWKAKLEAGDPEFLKEFETHPKVQGFIAGRADFLAKQQKAAEQAAAAEAERTRLRREDPEAYAALDEQLIQQQTAAKQQEDVVKTALTNSLGRTYVDVISKLPKAAVAEYDADIAGKDVDLSTFTGKVLALYEKHTVPALKEQWAKEELPALFKDYLAQKGESEPSPSLNTGSATTGSALTLEKYQSMSPSAHRKLASTAAGRAQIDALWAES